ncbi:MAG: hypothetical protein J1D87_08235 [Lachnospiraceae bacterium]|nr:hypothetical protein [Lachnospiraceae bacterium]
MQEAQKKIDDAQTSLKNISTTINDNKERFLELSQGVSQFSKNLTLSEDDYAEYLAISQKFAELSPSLIVGYDEQGNALLNIGKNAEETTEKLNGLLEAQQETSKQTLVDNLDAVAEGIHYEVKQINDSINLLEDELDKTKRASEMEFDISDIFKNGNGIFQFTDANDPFKTHRTAFIKALESANIGWEYLSDDQIFLNDFTGAANNGGKDGQEIVDIALKEAQEYYNKMLNLENTVHEASIAGYKKELADKENAIKASYSKMTANLQAWVEQNANYQYLSNGSQSIVDALIPEIDWSSLDIDLVSGQDYQNYINDNILMPLMSVLPENKAEIDKMFFKLLSFEDGDLDIIPFAEQLQARLKELGVVNELGLPIDITPIIANEQEAKDKLQNSIESISKGNDYYTSSGNQVDAQEYITLEEYTKDFTAAQVELWSKATLGAENATDAINKYEEELKNASDNASNMSKSGMIDSINSLSDGFDLINKIYSDIEDKGAFDFSNLDSKKFDEYFGKLGIEYDDFIDKVSESTDDIDSCKQVVNDLLNRYLEASGILGNINDENARLTASMLESMGISNAQVLVEESLLKNKAEMIMATNDYKNALEQSGDAMLDDINNILEEMNASEALRQTVAQITLDKQLANANSINTSDDVAAIYSLAEMAGFGAEALYNLSEARAFLAEAEASDDMDQINEAREAVRRIVTLEQQKLAGMAAKAQYTNKNTTKTTDTSKAAKEAQKEADAMSDLNSQIDKLQSAYKTLCDVRDTYNEYGKITVDQYQQLADMGFGFLSNLIDENGQLGLNAAAFEKLANAKLQEMQIQLARNAIDTINGIKSETEAVEYLTFANENLRDAALSATEALLYKAQAEARDRGEAQGLAADQIVKGYEASKMLVDKVEFGFDTSSVEKAAGDAKDTILDAYNEQKKLLDHMKAMDEITNAEYNERLMKLANDYFSGNAEYRDNLWEAQEQYHDYLESIKKTYNWIENLLSSLSKKTHSLIDKAEKFISWQKKNAMINRAIKAGDKEIIQNQNAYQIYMAKANSVGLSNSYKKKIQEGSLSIEDLSNEALSDKIEKYQEWYNKAQDVLDTINDLYDQQRDLIRQKLDNVLNYYSDLDSYLSSVTSKFESLISLNDEMGKRSSLTDLIEQFASLSERLDSVTNGSANNITSVTESEGSLGSSRKVAEAREHYKQERIDSIQSEIDNLNVDQSGTYTKLLNNIAKTQAQIDKYVANGWDVKKSKQFDKLTAKLQDYCDLQNELDQYATSNTIANYNKVYTAYQKLQNKLESGKTLSKSEQKKYDAYAAQIDTLRNQGQSALDDLYAQLSEANGTSPKQSEADRIQGELDGIQSKLENTATYQNLLRNIQKAENNLAELDSKDKLTNKQKKTYDKLQAQLEAYYAKKEALDENATAANIAEYTKIYDAWKDLQDKLDSGKNLSDSQWKKYNNYTRQLESFADDKASLIETLNDSLEEALNPGDKLEQIERAYEESAKQIYDSYQDQIDGINGDVTSTKQYQNLLAKAQKLEQKKDTKGLSSSEQAKLDKYNAELEALRTGGMSSNISDYIKTWESFYTLQQKLDKNGKLSEKDAKKYDEYKAKLEAWNNEKQDQINDLLSLMEDDLENLQKTYTENVAEAESEINDYYANLYSLAKQIAEYNISSLKTQLSLLESSISYCKELLSLYDSFSGDKLAKILIDLGEADSDGVVASQLDIYEKYLSSLQEKYNKTLAEINEYNQLLGALDEDDFESSMELFSKAMEGYRKAGNTEMADKLQSVLDLLNERAIDADNWGEYADEWSNEWEEALASVKQELIGTASEIQEVNDALRELSFENITNSIDELEKATGILSSIAGLIQDDWLFDDGKLSEYGRAKAALLVSQLENAQAKANEYLKLYNEIQNKQDTYASNKAYTDALNEALQNYYDSLGDAASLENSLMDLMKRTNEEEINSLKDIIEARKKALQAKKEYYDYDKSIKNAQKDVDSLKAQIAALESLTDATDAATKAKLAQLKAELKEKEDALQETKDEHTFNLQIDALDKLSDTLTDALDESSKSVEEILGEQRDIVESAKELYEESKDSVNETLKKLEEFYRGMGSDIDGTDYTPNTSVDNNSTSNDIYSSTTPSASAQDKQTLNEFVKAAHEAFKDGILVRASDEQLFKVTDENMLNFMQNYQNYILPMTDVVKAIPDFIRERDSQPLVINNHYDSLINVEGNVDKDVARLLPEQLRQSYEYTISRFTGEYKALHGGQLTVR